MDSDMCLKRADQIRDQESEIRYQIYISDISILACMCDASDVIKYGKKRS